MLFFFITEKYDKSIYKMLSAWRDKKSSLGPVTINKIDHYISMTGEGYAASVYYQISTPNTFKPLAGYDRYEKLKRPQTEAWYLKRTRYLSKNGDVWYLGEQCLYWEASQAIDKLIKEHEAKNTPKEKNQVVD